MGGTRVLDALGVTALKYSESRGELAPLELFFGVALRGTFPKLAGSQLVAPGLFGI
jgi:hypothetical protein